jgi:membrane-associated phospholipid phosphatase
MRKALAAVVALSIVAAAVAIVFAYQHATGSGTNVAADDSTSTSGTIVVDWNKELVRIVNTPGAQPATVHPTRSFAILHAAIYDAVVSTTHGKSPYLFSVTAPAGARPDAAAAEAARDTLAALYPSQKPALDHLLATEVAAMPNNASTGAGIAVGRLTATLMLAARANDGSSDSPPALPAGTQPGQYRPTPPNFAPAAFTQWPDVAPFVLRTGDQFRPAPPPALGSAAYEQAIIEVKSLGQNTSTTRTGDQTVVARFWPGPIWVTWNEIAEKAALAHHSDLMRTARLFVVLNLTFADTTIAFYDAKYRYLLWRPITAIRETTDPTWTPLLTTANDPSYPGAHSAISGAGAAVLTRFFGDRDRLSVTSDVLPGVVRTFDSYSAAATEGGLSRIYGGVHTRLDHEAGLQLGQDVAGFVLKQSNGTAFGA